MGSTVAWMHETLKMIVIGHRLAVDPILAWLHG